MALQNYRVAAELSAGACRVFLAQVRPGADGDLIIG